MCNRVTPAQLAEELGHDDNVEVIQRFMRDPDDGRGQFRGGPLFTRIRHLSPEQADRVRERFT